MQTHLQTGRVKRLTRYLLTGIALASIIIVLNWPDTNQDNPSRSENPDATFTVAANASPRLGGFPGKPPQQKASAGHDADSPALPDTGNGWNAETGTSESSATQQNQASEQSGQTDRKAQYQKLLADLNSLEGDHKLLQLQELWKLAPEVGIDDDLLTLLYLSTYDADENIAQMARKILDDLNRYREGITSAEAALVNQIDEMNNAAQVRARDIDAPLSAPDEQNIEQPAMEPLDVGSGDIEIPDTAAPPDIIEQRAEKIAALKALALDSDNPDTKDYAMNNLMRFDQAAALDVIQHQLQNSYGSDERILAIERLRSVIGDYDNDQIRQLLEAASRDYDDRVAEYANTTLTMLNDYLQPQDE